MKNQDFYKLLEQDLLKITAEFDENLNLKLKQDTQKQSYAFLIWFLNFYSGISNVDEYITDGHGDHSCDIILDKINSQGDKVFYLVQSKWNSLKNCDGQFENEVLKSYLSDVQSILKGDKENTENEKFNSRYHDLLNHVKSNGEVKVLYLTLKNKCTESDANIKSFENFFGGKVSVDCFDINRLKLDYIDRNFKKSSPPNPLEKIYNPEFEKITLSLVQDDERNLLKVDKPFQAHVFNILPKTIYELVLRYGVSLFDKNVRNPLVSSKINKEIVNSLKNDPSYFWYYNNGITAITRAIPAINSQAESFEVTGLQIINGAQTAYSIYLAYSEATPEEREIIDAEARITLRLLKSGGKDFDLKVTKFTNSQNPVSERDFWSTDTLQTKIQNYFYGTNIWYEKRSGEFRRKPKGVIKVPNNIVASAHLAFWLSKPVSVFEATMRRESDGIDLIFTSHKEHKDGLYETIFNSETQSKEVFSSFCMLDILTESNGFDPESIFFSNGFHVLSISKVVLKKYLDLKYNANVDLCNFIIKAYKNDDIEIIKKCIQHSSILMKNQVESECEEGGEKEIVINLMTKNSHFELLLERINKSNISVEDIEEVILNIDDENIDELDDSELNIIEEKIVH